jgi:Amidohydrolase
MCWVKLSGSYRITGEPQPPYGDVVEVGRTLISARASHCLWAPDWPHPQIPVPMPNDGDLLDQHWTWALDPESIRRILVDNPDRPLRSEILPHNPLKKNHMSGCSAFCTLSNREKPCRVCSELIMG